MKIQFLLKNTGMYERLGIMTLSSVLKANGHDVKLNVTEESSENKIVEHVKSKKVPVICFPKGIKKKYVDFCSIVKPDCISIDYEVDPKWIKEKLNGEPIQGGLDPKILLDDNEKIKKKVENYLNIFNDYPYIFNLGHGVLPETKPETIEYLKKIVRNKK